MNALDGRRAGVAVGVGVVAIGLVAGTLVSLSAASAPPTPINLTASVAGTTVTLHWRAGLGTRSNVTYRVETGTSAGASNVSVVSTRNRSLTVNNPPGGTYYVRVRAAYSGTLSAPSNEAQYTIGCAMPTAPAGFVAPVTGTTIAFAWQAVSGATNYRLEIGSSSGASNLGSMSVAATTYSTTSAAGTYFTRVRAVSACGTGAPSAEQVATVAAVTPPPPPPPPGTPTIWGMVDPIVLGTCTAAQHDAWVVDGGDGYLYRTWHPQVDPSGCIYAHEHGDNPALIGNAEIAASPVRFGYVGRRHPMPPAEPNGHEEAHEGFKVFVQNPGDVNDEGRVNRVYSRAVFHMGTGGPKRFNMPHHSAEIRLIHPEFGLKAFTQLMMDTGGVGAVCDPRRPAPVKDVIQLNSPCKLNSSYEIWSTAQSVMHGGREVYHAFATPAVFDSITVFNPDNPTELVYAWDPRVAASKNFPDDWSGHRGCSRESYAQPGYWYNSRGVTQNYTDAMGLELAATDPLALLQDISISDSISAPATNDGMVQFKMRRDYCQQASKLGLKN